MNITYKYVNEFTERDLKDLFLSVNWLSGNYPNRLVKAMRNSSTVISAWDGDKLIGLINALDDRELTAYVHYLLVNPDYQGHKIGQELVLKIKEKYKDYLYLILISEHKETIGFYEKCGLTPMEGSTPMKINKF